jgi:uncharacterized protein
MGSKIQYHPFKYFALTFISTWQFWFFPKLFSLDKKEETICMFIGLIAPFSVALWLIFTSKNETLKTTFFNKLLNLRLIRFNSLLAILLIPLASIIISITISTLFGFSLEQFTIATTFSFHIGLIPTGVVILLASIFEELGWRGYGMESLHSKFNYFNATFIFGILWSLWHLPLFFVAHTYHDEVFQLSPLYAVNLMISVIPVTFIISWICKKNSGSIPAAILLHFVINIAQSLFVVEPETKCIQTFVLTAIAALIVYYEPEVFFDKKTVPMPCPTWLSWIIEIENPFSKLLQSKTIIENAGIQRGMTVLDAGCGPGRVTIPIAHKIDTTGHLIAMDLQSRMLERTSQKVVKEKLSNVTFFHAALGDMRLKSNQFDRVLLVTVLGEVPDQNAALKEIFNALKPGGILSITETLFDPQHYQRQDFVLKLANELGFLKHSLFKKWHTYTLNLQKNYA